MKAAGWLQILAAGWLVFLLPIAVQAQPYPRARLIRVAPPGAKAGSTLELTVDGANLDDAESLYFSQTSIKSERLPAAPPKIDPKSKKAANTPPPPVTFKVHVPADTPVGIHDVRVIGKFGVSNARAFVVGKLSDLQEKEPNSDVPQAQKIELNATVNGTIDAKTDVDYFAFAGKQGQRVVFRVAGWNIDSKLSPMVQVFTEDGRQLVNKYSIHGDLVTDAVLPEDGTYHVRLCEFAYQQGGNDCFYRLTVSEAPWLDVAFPPVVEAGKTTAVEVLGRNLPDSVAGPKTRDGRPLDKATLQVTAPAQPGEAPAFRGFRLPRTLGLSGTELRVTEAGRVSNPLLLNFCHSPVTLESDTNDSPQTAQELLIPAEMCGRIEKQKDRDWYVFEGKKGEPIVLEAFADRLGAPMDLYLQIWRPEPLQMVTEIDDHSDLPTMVGQFWTRTEDPKTRWTPPADGKYLLMVTSRTAPMHAGPRFVYRLSVHPARPDFHVVLIDNQDGNSGGFTLERGGAQDFGVLCMRKDGFTGEVRLEADGLPKGVTCEPQIVGPEVTQAALILRAAADAPLTFGTFTVKATASVEGKQVVRHAQAGTLIWPNNQKNAPAHSRLTRSLCIAVREPGPFTLDVPVRTLSAAVGTNVEVKVRASRSANFKAAIALTRLSGPVAPGGKAIAIPNVNLAANQTDGTVKFQLPANTPPGSYSLVLQGKGKVAYQPNPKAKAANVDFLTATPPITLNVFNSVAELTLDKPGITLKPGDSATLRAKLKRLHNYKGPIQIELVPQPGVQGITAPTVNIAADKSEGQLVVQAPKNAKTGVFPNFVVRASAKLDGVVLKEEVKVQVSISDKVSGDDQAPKVKELPLLPESSAGWKYLPAKMVIGKTWQAPDFDDKSWKLIASPAGYGESEVAQRKGTTLTEQGEAICFRREVVVAQDLLAQKGVTFRLLVASDDGATVFVNGQSVDKDDGDHEFSYWNRDVFLPASVFRPGRNVIAVLVTNKVGSSDLYFDLALRVQTPVAKTQPKK